ncbi:hypothetical protein FN846DRAFT_983819 [Sphaerosporella brunnea]|uniref:Uncharacterized protein n=1 Tax=Sphaerosporella brunnea TaxID=1250544 RepID=A0A5J5EV65_9PEZI|nr:hypothetical protein FN846DRAFT_983819 [Sphaerosporella brunnea]
MTTHRTRHDCGYDYDFNSFASSDLVLSEDLHHNSWNPSAEAPLSLRPTGNLIRSSTGYPHHDSRVRFHPPRRETDTVTLSEAVRNNNRQTDRTNRRIQPGSKYSQIHPKMKDDGMYPRDFKVALTVDQLETMDLNTLDRILISYGLLCTFTGHSRDIKRQKLWRLYEFLGADGLRPLGHGSQCASHMGSAYATDGGTRYITW